MNAQRDTSVNKQLDMLEPSHIMKSHIKIYKGLMMKHMQRNQEIVALHKQRVQSVVAWNCNLLSGALAGGTDVFAVEALELLPSRLMGQPLAPQGQPAVSDTNQNHTCPSTCSHVLPSITEKNP